MYQYIPTFTSPCVHISVSQLLDAFGHKSNISLVFDYMETDLEVRLSFMFCSYWDGILEVALDTRGNYRDTPFLSRERRHYLGLMG